MLYHDSYYYSLLLIFTAHISGGGGYNAPGGQALLVLFVLRLVVYMLTYIYILAALMAPVYMQV